MAKVLRIWLQLTYRCCGMEWTEEWPTPLKFECPDCRELIEPAQIIEIGPRQASRKLATKEAERSSRR